MSLRKWKPALGASQSLICWWAGETFRRCPPKAELFGPDLIAALGFTLMGCFQECRWLAALGFAFAYVVDKSLVATLRQRVIWDEDSKWWQTKMFKASWRHRASTDWFQVPWHWDNWSDQLRLFNRNFHYEVASYKINMKFQGFF